MSDHEVTLIANLIGRTESGYCLDWHGDAWTYLTIRGVEDNKIAVSEAETGLHGDFVWELVFDDRLEAAKFFMERRREMQENDVASRMAFYQELLDIDYDARLEQHTWVDEEGMGRIIDRKARESLSDPRP